MSNDPAAIPLADVFRAANDLVAAGLIEDYALGGALAAIYYVEPLATYDADIVFVAAEKGLTAGIPAIYAHLQERLARRTRASTHQRLSGSIPRRRWSHGRSRVRSPADRI